MSYDPSLFVYVREKKMSKKKSEVIVTVKSGGAAKIFVAVLPEEKSKKIIGFPGIKETLYSITEITRKYSYLIETTMMIYPRFLEIIKMFFTVNF